MAGGKRRDEQPDLGVTSLDRERELTIDVLSQHFAHDNLSIEELERRITEVYRAASVPALRELTRDLPGAVGAAVRPAAAVPEIFTPEQDDIYSVMSETRRRGFWRPARHLNLWSVMSETHLDFTEAQLAEGVTEVDVRGIMTSIKIIIPPGVRVVVQPWSFMAEVADESIDPPALGSAAPVLRITGFVFMAELKVRVRHRELRS